MSEDKDGIINLRGMNWEKQIGNYKNIMQAIGASPSLIVGGERNVDRSGLQNDYGFLNEYHPRLTFGNDDKYLIFIIVHGRNSLKGYYGTNIEGLVSIGLKKKVKNLINLDGGGSIRVIDGEGNSIEDNPGNRLVDNIIVLVKK